MGRAVWGGWSGVSAGVTSRRAASRAVIARPSRIGEWRTSLPPRQPASDQPGTGGIGSLASLADVGGGDGLRSRDAATRCIAAEVAARTAALGGVDGVRTRHQAGRKADDHDDCSAAGCAAPGPGPKPLPSLRRATAASSSTSTASASVASDASRVVRAGAVEGERLGERRPSG